jgi:Flp pilus assembly protein TadB
MSDPHGIDPRAQNDPRNVYPSEEEFYGSDRPDDPVLAEDRPRGGAGETAHRGRLFMVVMIAFVVLVVVVWVLAFP